MVVYLYRENRNAQLASWEKASRTGEWLAGYFSEPTDFPANAVELIEQAKSIYKPIAKVVLSYETLIADWEATIARILAIAGWGSFAIYLPDKQP